ncbi:MAG: glycosyltransferase family 2 protein [Phycisphaeraceae bacterium]|nr:glycosyltransferase family 2 protein [Phycisphaeraceae bacterium]
MSATPPPTSHATPSFEPGQTPGTAGTAGPTGHRVLLSVVAPAHNEEGNVAALVEEVGRACLGDGRGNAGLTWPDGTRVGQSGFEFIIVDDGSTDSTRARVAALMADGRHPWLRCIAMTKTPPGKGNGQSAAFQAGFAAARGELIATLDADLQNDPADIPAMLELMRQARADMVQGDRSHARKDSIVRRYGSMVGRAFRRWLLGDTIRDTGCSLRIMKREIAVQLPLTFKGMHRFIPVTARHMGYTVVEMRVSHRPRTAGETKYGMGITKRAIPGLVDLFAVRYMRNRRRNVEHAEIGVAQAGSALPKAVVSVRAEAGVVGGAAVGAGR